MKANEELRKYVDPAVAWIERHLTDPNISEAEKKKLILLREFIKEQTQNEDSHPPTS